MTQFRSHFWITVAALVLAGAAWFANDARSVSVWTQEPDKVLEIERYPDEPVQFVNIRVGTQSVKDRVKTKLKDNKSKWAIESVNFKEKDDWYKRISITLRNASDKPVFGLEGNLFFRPVGHPMGFILRLTGSRQLGREPLLPGAEFELTVNEGLLNQTLAAMRSQGTDVSLAVVSFSLDMVTFSDELKWYRGKLLQPDAETPGKWVPVDQPLAMKRSKPLATTPSFVRVSFNPEPVQPPMVFATCKEYNGTSFTGVACAGDASRCITRTDSDTLPTSGPFSHKNMSGLCIDFADLGQVCTTSTVHSRFEFDTNCPPPCPDADNDTFQSKACGGDDCNDSNGDIKPGAEEDCFDGVDNNCDNCSCDMLSEMGEYQAGGGIDCAKCNDGEDNDCDGPKDHLDDGCGLCQGTPVLIDVSGNGFNLTNTANGVNFDLDNDGTKERYSWTAAQTDDAWLALDRNGDGAITNGTELFGNFTPQSIPPSGFGRNGFNALVEYDQRAKGGNGDGLITAQDSVFGSLRLWQDKNHNGVSEANELTTLNQLGLKAIECNYKISKRTDQHGNAFRYRAKVIDARNTRVNRWAWDVFLVRDTTTNTSSLANNEFKPVDRKISLDDYLLVARKTSLDNYLFKRGATQPQLRRSWEYESVRYEALN